MSDDLDGRLSDGVAISRYFACALTFAQRFLAAAAIRALPAAESTRFLTQNPRSTYR